MASKAAASALKPKSAEHTLYHAHPTGFWKKLRDATVINPEISTGLPIPSMHRYPQPGSRTERYSTPSTMASDVAQNPYWKRDTRRNYPQASVVSQEQLTGLLLASEAGQKALPQPTSVSLTTTLSTLPPLTTVLASLPASYTSAGISASTGATGLPPKPPTYKWKPVLTEDIPHDKDAYWPMVAYK